MVLYVTFWFLCWKCNINIIFLVFGSSGADNTAGVVTRRNGYSRSKMSTYLLPVIIFDNDYPIQSSTGTLSIRVCACDSRGNMQSCNAEALLLPAGLSTGALIAILLCIIILLSKWTISSFLICTWKLLKETTFSEELVISLIQAFANGKFSSI